MEKNPFILIPLPLLKELIVDAETINTMFHVGIYFTANKINVSENDAYKEFIYCIYRDLKGLTDQLIHTFHTMVDFPYDEDYNGFDTSGNEFNPEEEFEYLLSYSEENPDFHHLLMAWYKIRQVYKMLELNTETVKYTILLVNEHLKKYSFEGCPFILLNGKVMMNIYTQKDKMQADERAVWAMYLGILSIIGNKEFACTTSDMIKCRMFGAKNKDELTLLLKNKTFKKAHDKYTSKYQYHKLLNIIQDRNMITEIGLNRRTYVSYKLKTLNELVDAISMKGNRLKRRQQRNEEKAKAIERFFASQQNE
ncbi:hypothetical protein [Bacteroides sp. 224]|uniref:hypothetical protein n=1 Tax=Bacteroides sp. 224 TaxID=2302936 RepID=UPI0013D31D49|nr:hypothetical protein [Bacteroides sp. 224]NDV64599.1 hypothetical protein [Bacteroides sp. 224]